MSNGILKNRVGLADGWNTKLRAMPGKKQESETEEDLADYVRRIRKEKGLSLKDVEERSGKRISKGYVSQIENRYYINPTRDKLIALAKGLGVLEDEIFIVARGKTPTDNPDYKSWKFASLFDDAQRLTPEQMREFEHLMEVARREVQRMLQEQAKESNGSSGSSRRPRKP